MTACLPIRTDPCTETKFHGVACTKTGFHGVACVDMLMRDLIADVTEFQYLDIGYNFMINGGGR